MVPGFYFREAFVNNANSRLAADFRTTQSDPPHVPWKPMFSEPWQARLFGLTLELQRQKHFTWQEWAIEFAKETSADPAREHSDEVRRYYLCWMTALEHLITAKGLVGATELLRETRS